MLTLLGSGSQFCDGVSRRAFLKVGALGVGGISLADILRADAQAGRADSHKAVINIYQAGGPSHIDTFDPKPEAPKEFRGEFAPIETCVSGIQICEHLPRLAGLMDKLTIIRSLAGLVDEHAPNQTESGWHGNLLKSIGGHPSFGSVIARLTGASHGSAPTFVDLSGVARHGFLGPVYGAFRPDGEGRADLKLNSVSVDRLGERRELLAGLDRLRRDVDHSGMMQAMDSFSQRAVGVVTSGRLANALDLQQEDPRLRRRYSLTEKNEGSFPNDPFLTARRLVEAGVRCVSLAWGGWDTHGDNFGHLKRQLPAFDQGVGTLIEDLSARGMLDDVVVLVWGEFGRTPRVNGTAGRDHWPRAASVLMAGGSLRMGQVIGSTNRLGEEPKDRPVHLHEVFATLYNHMGIDPRYTTLIDPNGRPQYLVEHPLPVKELLA